MRRACARLLMAATFCLLGGGPAFAQSALLRFTQGSNVGASGQALKGVIGTAVTVANSSSTGIQSWQIDVAYSPPGSSVAIATLASNDASGTPTATFTPDKVGGYRFVLKVWSATGRHGLPTSVDYRNFLVGGRTNGFVPPPAQGWPQPLPPLASGLPGAKPDEINPSGCQWGFAGCGAGDGLLNDFIASVDARLQKTVTNIAALAALDTTDAANGLQVYVVSVGDWFDLAPNSGATAQPLVLVAASDGRQWKRVGRPNRHFLAATFWSVSPSTGSDEAIGWGLTESAADAHPLATMIELNRRLVGWNEDNTAAGLTLTALSIHLLSDVMTTSTFSVLTNIHSHNSEKYIRLRGTLTAVDGSATNRTITGYQPAVPASNTEREITISGLGLAPQYIGEIVQTTDGLKTAIVTRQNSSNHLSISEVRDNASGINGVASIVTDFAVNDHVTFYDPTKLALWPFPPNLPFPILAQVRLDVGATGMFPGSFMGKSAPLISQCILGSGVASRDEYNINGGYGAIYLSDAIFATHANGFLDGTGGWNSVAVLVAGDGPFVGNYSLTIGDEASFVSFGAGGVGIRNTQVEPCTVTVGDTGSIASFGMGNSTINLVGTHGGVPGDFFGSDSNNLGHKSRWYGSGNTAVMLVLGQGTRSKFPKSGITATTSATYPINLAGIGVSDTFHNYNWSDIPIVDISTNSAIVDSNPATSGGSF